MPRHPRFFISPEQVSDQSITISGEDVSHIVKVLRMKTGDELLLCDGNGTEYSVNIAQVNKSGITTEVKARSKREIRSPLITLGQGLPKSDKMDWIVQKATELGVAAIVPLVTERTIVKIKDEEKRVSRWQKIAREAAMQSNRPDIPTVGAVIVFQGFSPNSELRTPNFAPPPLGRCDHFHQERSPPDARDEEYHRSYRSRRRVFRAGGGDGKRKGFPSCESWPEHPAHRDCGHSGAEYDPL